MFLSTIPDPVELDDYAVHQRIMMLTDGRKALFQRKGTSIDILTAEPLEGSRDISRHLAGLAAGQSLLFTIRLNPVVSKKLEKGQRGKRRQPGETTQRISHAQTLPIDWLTCRYSGEAGALKQRAGSLPS